MRHLALLSLLALSAAAPASEPTAKQAAREAANGEVVFSHYPARALAAGEQGSVIFKVALDRDGHPTSCEVTFGSGYPRLDEETCNLILVNAVFKPNIDESGRKFAGVHEGVVNWKIPGAESLTGKVVKAGQTDPLDKKICKKAIKTGTLAGVERSCMTVREWQTASQEMKKEWEEMQGAKGMTAGKD